MNKAERLQNLLDKIDAGSANYQDKIDAAYLLAKSGHADAVAITRKLVEDPEEMVRYFALQVLVIDLGVVTEESENLCWRLLNADPDDDVRYIAAACLGKILHSSKRIDAFRKLKRHLKKATESNYVKKAISDTIIQLTGQLPPEWRQPSQGLPDFSSLAVDWEMIKNIEISLLENSDDSHR